MFSEKLVLKSQTGLSLHERFTALRGIKPVPASGPEPAVAAIPQRQIEYYTPPPRPASVSRRPRGGATSQPQYHGLFDARREVDSNSFSRTPRRPTLAFQAALKLKKKSIKQRLGPFKNRTFFQNYPRYNQRRGYQRGRPGGYHRGNQRLQRHWTSTHSLASDGTGRHRRGGGGGGSWRGNRRGGGRFRGRQSRGGGRGRYPAQPKMTKEELDAQLDSYMSNTKTVLDRDLDAYMSQGASTSST